GGVKKIVFDFNRDDKDAVNTSFGACYELASYIAGLRVNTQTVAFVHGKVAGHTVLPVLACQEVVMSPAKEAKLGEVVAEGVSPLGEPERAAYRAIFAREGQMAIVRKMYDPNVQLA